MGSVSHEGRRLAATVMLGLAAVLAAPFAADAQTTTSVSIGDRQITLIIDADQCEMDRNNPSDARVYQLVERGLEGNNQLLMAAADCGQLTEWRSGARPTLDDFTQVQVGLANRSLELTGREAATAKQICTELRQQGDAIVAGPVAQVRERFNKATEDVKLNETTFIGVVHEDPQACYASLVQKVRTDRGRDKLILSVFANVVVRGRLLFIYRYTEGESFASVVRLTDLLRKTVAAHLSANR